jgi:adenylyltransferase/sulfurtransferase
MSDQLSQEELLRYSRQVLLPELGRVGQRKLKSTSVLIIGVGGLGSPVALYLAAAGIGRIGLVDDDVVDVSNLQRQIIHDTPHVGVAKVDSACERLLALNPTIRVEAVHERFTIDSAERIAAGYDIVVDCADNFATRYLINDLCVLTHRPDVFGAVNRFDGQVSVFDSRSGPCLRCLFPEPPPQKFAAVHEKGGLLGVLSGVIGSLQAAEVLKLAASIGKPLIGSMIAYDVLGATFQTLKVEKNPSCRGCGGLTSITELE